MTTSADDLVARYLARLRDELHDVRGSGATEVVQEIAEHIVAARGELADESEADVRNILERLGDPAEIAADARDRFGVADRRSGWREIAALVLLPFGGVILPVVGWFVGLVLLWLSDAWTRRDKLIGTLVVPGGLLLPVLLLVLGTSAESCTGPVGGPLTCGESHTSVLLFVVLGALLVAPFLTDWYLARRLRR